MLIKIVTTGGKGTWEEGMGKLMVKTNEHDRKYSNVKPFSLRMSCLW